jgi:hypothetical protein
MSKNDEPEMRKDFPNDDLLAKTGMTNVLADENDVVIWYDDSTNQDFKVVFVNVGNATMSMPEPVFYTLTKLCQTSAKKLLNIT